jgi:hypothetical protein
MNILQRIGAALTRQIDRENEATSLNTAVMTASGAAIRSNAITAEPDWKAIAEELAEGLGDLIDAMLSQKPPISECMAVRAARIKARKLLTSYQAAKQVKP